jgi:hypothetical protein
MVYLILGILLLSVLAPLAMPWGKSLLVYSIIMWFALWIAFFFQMERESSPAYDAGIVSDGVVLVLLIIVYIIVISVRCIYQFIRFKTSAQRNHT